MQPLEDAPELVDRIERITAGSLAEQLASTTPPLVIDVRSAGEWREHRIDAAVNQPLSQFPASLAAIERGRPVVAYCGSGYRSAIAASLLQRDGLGHVSDLVGGLAAWQSAKLPITSPPSGGGLPDLRTILLHDTRTGTVRELEPREPGKVGIYACGPTVYGRIHVG